MGQRWGNGGATVGQRVPRVLPWRATVLSRDVFRVIAWSTCSHCPAAEMRHGRKALEQHITREHKHYAHARTVWSHSLHSGDHMLYMS